MSKSITIWVPILILMAFVIIYVAFGWIGVLIVFGVLAKTK